MSGSSSPLSDPPSPSRFEGYVYTADPAAPYWPRVELGSPIPSSSSSSEDDTVPPASPDPPRAHRREQVQREETPGPPEPIETGDEFEEIPCPPAPIAGQPDTVLTSPAPAPAAEGTQAAHLEEAESAADPSPQEAQHADRTPDRSPNVSEIDEQSKHEPDTPRVISRPRRAIVQKRSTEEKALLSSPAESPAKRRKRGPSKWEASFVLTSAKSPLGNHDIRHILSLPEAWDVLDKEEKEQVLSLFPSEQHILDPGSDSARPDIASLKYDDNFRHDCARYTDDLQVGFHDKAWLADAFKAHEMRKAGFFDEFVIEAFESDWNSQVPDAYKPKHMGAQKDCSSQLDAEGGYSLSNGDVTDRGNEVNGFVVLTTAKSNGFAEELNATEGTTKPAQPLLENEDQRYEDAPTVSDSGPCNHGPATTGNDKKIFASPGSANADISPKGTEESDDFERMTTGKSKDGNVDPGRDQDTHRSMSALREVLIS